ncbi:hypothetical protein FRB94_010729 [Tulasnella sp. JGI-2019a]|nr:hypothetical protein FRB94_010729 [Tulasnella sp. JGI-2019a]KAG8996250.1 hypothetical protein FRB93_000916 [Tulasnella sp. JGI-2019a]
MDLQSPPSSIDLPAYMSMPYAYQDPSSTSTSISSESPPHPATPTEIFPHQQNQHQAFKSQGPHSPYDLREAGAIDVYDPQQHQVTSDASTYSMSSESRHSAQSLSHILTSFKTLDATGDTKSPIFPLQPASVTNHRPETYSVVSSSSSAGDASSSCSPADLFQAQKLQYQPQTPASELSSAGDALFFRGGSSAGGYGSEHEDSVHGGSTSQSSTTSAIRLTAPSTAHDDSRRENWPMTSEDISSHGTGSSVHSGERQYQQKHDTDMTPTTRYRPAYSEEQHFGNAAPTRQTHNHFPTTASSSGLGASASLPPMRTSSGPILPHIGDLTGWPPLSSISAPSSASSSPHYSGLGSSLVNHRFYPQLGHSNNSMSPYSHTLSHSAPPSIHRTHSSQYGRSLDDAIAYSQRESQVTQQYRMARSDGWNPEYIPGGADYTPSNSSRLVHNMHPQQSSLNQYGGCSTSSFPPQRIADPSYYGSLHAIPKNHTFPGMRFEVEHNRPTTSSALAGMAFDGHSMAITYTDNSGEKETPHLRRKCFNCSCTEPPSWRRSTMTPGKIVCNRCGLYERTHNRARPSTAVGDLRKLGSKGMAQAYPSNPSCDPYTSMPTNAKTGESLRTSKKMSPHEQHQHAPYQYQ